MKKRIATAAAFAACLALCSAVWPQNEPTQKTSAPPTPPTVIAAQPEVPGIPEIEETITTPEPTPPPKAVSVVPAQESTPEQGSEVNPTSPDSTPENMVCVPGFGWLENHGPNHCEYAEDMYENGNKIGRMN